MTTGGGPSKNLACIGPDRRRWRNEAGSHGPSRRKS